MEAHYLKPLQPNEFERTLAEVFVRTHRCPWYKNLFNKSMPTFTYSQTSSGIGLYSVVRCDKCGKHFDITDYEAW